MRTTRLYEQASFQRKVVFIHEPVASKTSKEILMEDDEDGNVQVESVRQSITRDAFGRSMKRFEVNHVIQNILNGDPIITVAQLTLLYDFHLNSQFFQHIFHDHHGTEIIVNLLEVKDEKCNIAALKCIDKMASSKSMRLYFTNIGIIPLLTKLLENPSKLLQLNVCLVISQLCRTLKPARYLRKYGGLPKLIDLLDIPEGILITPFDQLTDRQQKYLAIATAAMACLKEVSIYPKTAHCLYRHGVVRPLSNISRSCQTELQTRLFQFLANCASNKEILGAIENEGILMALLKGLESSDRLMQTSCASALATCAAESAITRHMVRLLGALPTFVQLLKDLRQDQVMLSQLTRAIAKLADDSRNLRQLSEHNVVQHLIRFLKKVSGNVEIMTNILEGLAQCARLEENTKSIVAADCIPIIVGRLRQSNPNLVVATAQCLGQCAWHGSVADVIRSFDGMRLLLSALRNEDPRVVATALWALHPLVKNCADSAEEIRCTTGSITLLIKHMHSNDSQVVANACGLVAVICADSMNLYVLSDCGVVPALAECALAHDVEVRIKVAEAVAQVCALRRNAKQFGELGVVQMMRHYLDTSDHRLHTAAMCALAELTREPFNCILLHESDGIKLVLRDACAPHPQLQLHATNVLRNVRLAAENAHRYARSTCDPRLAKLGATRRTSRPKLQANQVKGMYDRFFQVAKHEILDRNVKAKISRMYMMPDDH